jgi:ppGpp synthetase/RelA/SpoT-type nucleotidyltranferase
MLSKSQIDRLGERLREGHISDDDLRMLDDYRRSFSEVYDLVVGTIQSELRLEPTGRPAKSTSSISEKLMRESIRLTQIQDIAGCRIVVPDIFHQEKVLGQLVTMFENSTLQDRRLRPSHGYRAVHIITHQTGKTVEIQLRTLLQHTWAELSEKMADVFDPSIKYGGGTDSLRKLLDGWSGIVKMEEDTETALADTRSRIGVLLSRPSLSPADQVELIDLQADVVEQLSELNDRRAENLEAMKRIIDDFGNLRKGN